MLWTEQHDIYLLREILHLQPWSHRYGSVERGQCWDEIAAILISLEDHPIFKVTPRSVRDRYSLLVKKYKKKWSEEAKASGISPEHSEIDEALLDLIQRFDEADNERKKETAGKKSKIEEELVKAQEIRKLSLETFGESRKRKGDTEGQGKRSHRSSSDAFSFLTEKSEREFTLRQEELKLKQQDLALRTQQIQNAQQTQQAQFAMLQQQNVLMLEMFKKFNNNKQ